MFRCFSHHARLHGWLAFLVHRVMNIFLWFVFSFTRQINSTKASAHFVSVPVNFISTHNARDWWTSKLCLWTSKKKAAGKTLLCRIFTYKVSAAGERDHLRVNICFVRLPSACILGMFFILGVAQLTVGKWKKQLIQNKFIFHCCIDCL